MNSAVCAVIEKKMGYHKASIVFKVLKTTLQRYVKKKKNSCDEAIKVIKADTMKRSAVERRIRGVPLIAKQRKTFRTAERWANKDAFSFQHFHQVSDVSSISTNESGSSNRRILDSTPSEYTTSECERHSSLSGTKITNSLHFLEGDNDAEGNAREENYVKTSNIEEVTISYSDLEVESDSETESNEVLNELITAFSSPKLYSICSYQRFRKNLVSKN